MNDARILLAAGALAFICVGLSYRLLLGDASYAELARRDRLIAQEEAEVERLRARNTALAAEVLDLRSGLDTVEERARADLGMVRPGEVYYRVLGEDAAP